MIAFLFAVWAGPELRRKALDAQLANVGHAMRVRGVDSRWAQEELGSYREALAVCLQVQAAEERNRTRGAS